MPYCPNPECQYRRRFGESAEFNLGITTCSDCGAQLSDEDVLGTTPKKPFTLTDVHKRVLWTLLLLGFWRVLQHLSLPGINYDVLSQMPERLSMRFSIFSLGLIPYVSAYVLVELLALFLQPLKRWRQEGGYEGRARLVRTARLATLILAIVHAGSLVSTMGRVATGQALIDSVPGFRLLLVLTLVAGTFLMIWIADMISAKGVGHGISILFLASTVGAFPHDVAKMLGTYQGENKFIYFIVPLLALIGLIILIVYMEKTTKQVPVKYADGLDAAVPLKLTTAGTVPSGWANTILAIPAIILTAYDVGEQSHHGILQWWAGNFYPGATGRAIAYSILVIVLYYVFTAFFYNPKSIAGFLKEKSAVFKTLFDDGGSAVDRGLERMALIGSLYLILLTFSLDLVWRLCGIHEFTPDGIELIVTVCIALDLISEVRFRWNAEHLVKVAEFQEPWKAGLLRSLLHRHNIPSVTRGYYHRALLYFFGPYIEISTYVPHEQENAANEVMREHLQLS